jgi:hypothetical protein
MRTGLKLAAHDQVMDRGAAEAEHLTCLLDVDEQGWRRRSRWANRGGVCSRASGDGHLNRPSEGGVFCVVVNHAGSWSLTLSLTLSPGQFPPEVSRSCQSMSSGSFRSCFWCLTVASRQAQKHNQLPEMRPVQLPEMVPPPNFNIPGARLPVHASLPERCAVVHS